MCKKRQTHIHITFLKMWKYQLLIFLFQVWFAHAGDDFLDISRGENNSVLTSDVLSPGDLKFPFSAQLDDQGKMSLKWDFNETDITFEVTCETTGWMGIGISPSKTMEDADLMTMFVDNRGRVVLTDWLGIRNPFFNDWFEVKRDSRQDLTVLYGNEVDGKTIVAFTRKIKSCDENDRSIKEGETVRLLWAYKEEEDPIYYNPSAPEEPFIMMAYPDLHTYKGSRSISLLNHIELNKELPDENIETFDIVNNLVVPPQLSYYNCQVKKLPHVPMQEYHVVRIEPIITTKYVHHMVLSRCTIPLKSEYNDKRIPRCYDDISSDVLVSCNSKVIAGWGAGGGMVDMPTDVGLSIGGIEESFFFLKTHYDNPWNDEGVVDQSGLRLHYTSSLRPINAGLLNLGELVSEYQVIPPGATEWTTESICPAECMDKGMEIAEVDKINVFGVLFHTHSAGVRMKLGQIRNGTELPPILQDDYFDSRLQQFVFFNETKAIEKGDSLITECTYNTEGRENVTYGGFSPKDEMCLVFVLYYPKIANSVCTTWRKPRKMHRIFGARHKKMEPFLLSRDLAWKSEAGKKAKMNLEAMKWSHLKLNVFNGIINKTPYHTRCTNGPPNFTTYHTKDFIRYKPKPQNETCR